MAFLLFSLPIGFCIADENEIKTDMPPQVTLSETMKLMEVCDKKPTVQLKQDGGAIGCVSNSSYWKCGNLIADNKAINGATRYWLIKSTCPTKPDKNGIVHFQTNTNQEAFFLSVTADKVKYLEKSLQNKN